MVTKRLFKNSVSCLKRHALLCVAFNCLAAVLFISGCEDNFQPLEENDEYFYSIYGFLDASADTQWIRIMPVRETTEYSDEPIDATVTLENIDTGEISTMNDSLFFLPQAQPGDAKVWNFWTTMDIRPSHSYTLTTERSDGAITTTTVDIPDPYPDPNVEFNYIEVTGVNNIAEVRVDWKVRDRRNNTLHNFRIVQEQVIFYQNPDRHVIVVYPDIDFRNKILRTLKASQPQVEILDTEVVLTVAGSDWIDFSELERDVIALPEATSNIENGVGYMVGTIIKTIPYPVCVGDRGEIVPC